MRILITVHTYWPNKDGVQYVTQYLAEGLVNKGHFVEVLTSVSDKKLEGTEFRNGVLIRRIFLITKYTFFYFGKKNFLAELEKVNQFDIIVNCCTQSPINNLFLKYIDRIKCKKVLYFHGMHDFRFNDNEPIRYKLWHIFMNFRWSLFFRTNVGKFNKYDCFIDIHESSKAITYFKKIGVNVPFHIIHNAVEKFSNEIKNNSKEKYFLNVANYSALKNQEMIIDAFNKIQDKHGYKLVLIGRGSLYSKTLKERFGDLIKKSEIVLIEDLSREKTKEYIENSSCGIMASLKEVYPIFLCECIMCGHPFISTDVGCAKNIPGGIIVKNRDEMTNAMLKIISDDDYLLSLGRAGYKFAKDNLTQEEKVQELNELLISLVK